MNNLSFKVSLQKGAIEIPVTSESPFLSEVIEWYKCRFEALMEFMDISITKFDFDRYDNVFRVVYENTGEQDEAVVNELISDPDDDGNYPFTTYNTEWFIVSDII
jgi:hypothetical protein